MTPAPEPVRLPTAEQWLMRSRVSGREYRIAVAKPEFPPPPDGYPVLYFLDANAVFATAAEAVRIQSRRPEKTGVPPMLVVGIGYRSDEPFPENRHYDLAFPFDPERLPEKPDGGVWPERGGGASFLGFLETELMPLVESRFRVDATRRTLFGHSLGGLFVLHALFTRPGLFSAYVAGSPSVHWYPEAVRRQAESFLALRSAAGPSSPGAGETRLLLAVGELEIGHKSRVYEYTRQLAEALGRPGGIAVRFSVIADEGHVTMLPALVGKALRFAAGGR